MGEDLGDLSGRFSFAKNHFGHALAEGAMVIDLGESEVFEWEMAETLHRLVGRELSGAYFLENASESGGVHLVDIVEEVRG
jgi:hypothetical protein